MPQRRRPRNPSRPGLKHQTPIVDVTVREIVESVPAPARASLLPEGLRGRLHAFKAADSPLGTAIRNIPGGRTAVFALLALAHDDDVQAVNAEWAKLNHNEKNCVRMEDLVERAGLLPEDFIGLISRISYRFNTTLGNAMANVAFPRLMKKSLHAAEKLENAGERRMHLEHAGYATSARGPLVSVTQMNANSIKREPDEGEAPSVAHTARRIVRDLPPEA